MVEIYVRGQLTATDLPLKDETVSIQSHQQQIGQQHRGRAETAHQIMEQLYTSERPMTRLQILKSLNRAKSPHLIGILEQMVTEGLIVRHEYQQRNGLPCYLYEPNR